MGSKACMPGPSGNNNNNTRENRRTRLPSETDSYYSDALMGNILCETCDRFIEVDPATRKGYMTLYGRLLAVVFIPLAVMFVISAVSLGRYNNKMAGRSADADVTNVLRIVDVVAALSAEREAVLRALWGMEGTNVSLQDHYRTTLAAMDNYDHRPSILNINQDWQTIKSLTEGILAGGKIADLKVPEAEAAWQISNISLSYDRLLQTPLEALELKVSKFDHDHVWTPVVALLYVTEALENALTATEVGCLYWTLGWLPMDYHRRFVTQHALAEDRMTTLLSLSQTAVRKHKERLKHHDDVPIAEYDTMVKTILTNKRSSPNMTAFKQWLTAHDNQNRRYVMTSEAIRADIVDALEYTNDVGHDVVAKNVTLMVLACLLAPLAWLSVHWISTNIYTYAKDLADSTKQVAHEKHRSEKLLLQMLPRSVASQLRYKGDVLAETFDSVTVYFSDICEFAEIVASTNAIRVVSLLNSVYDFLDSKIDMYHVYKVETISDVYMVASGLPLRIEYHLVELARMTLDIRDSLKIPIPHKPHCNMRMRFGLNTGPIVAGVVGKKMPRYCLFGDTVNTAARMQTNSEPMKIQVSEKCGEELLATGRFNLTFRGTVQIKGKGTMSPYWLDSEKDDSRQQGHGDRMN